MHFKKNKLKICITTKNKTLRHNPTIPGIDDKYPLITVLTTKNVRVDAQRGFISISK